MNAFKKIRLWLGWGPMVLSREYEIRAVENENRATHPPDAPFRTLTFKRMDFYRNQILVMNAFMTFVMLSAGWFYFTKMGKELVIKNAREPLLVGAIVGFGYGIYQTLNYRKKLFKEGKLLIGHKKPRTYKYWLSYYLLYLISFLGIWYILGRLYGSPGFLLAIWGFALPYILIQWLWYFDINRWERKQNKTFIWKPQGWYKEVVIETVERRKKK